MITKHLDTRLGVSGVSHITTDKSDILLRKMVNSIITSVVIPLFLTTLVWHLSTLDNSVISCVTMEKGGVFNNR